MPAKTPAAPAPAPEPARQPDSVLGRLRANRMGALTGGLVVGIALALLLSILVPSSSVLLALIVLGLAEAAAVGFTVRFLSVCRGLKTQLAAFVAAAVSMHILAGTGLVNSTISDALGGLGGLLGDGAGSGLGWDDALLSALSTPTVSTGVVLVGLVAAIIAGWGVRGDDHDHDHHHSHAH